LQKKAGRRGTCGRKVLFSDLWLKAGYENHRC
jgi:hypothetical protein